jgi:NADPH-dependent glutamate synthase beta subunit-like oxidoreductase/Pyruvate/2-oxoacid:ferredoxin oxidoreductase delta subunit
MSRPHKGSPVSRPREGGPVKAKDAVPSTWTTGSTEVFKTGTWRAALPQHIHAPSPCHAACPVNGDIAEWIGRARARDFHGAWEILTRHNPFPAVAGRICHHPCEAACNRVSFDGSLAICRLERHVGDQALAESWAFAPVEAERGQRIAVVGGGPSGLSAAFHLRRRGYAVTLFESRPELGGLMRYGIPSYRLARSVLDGEIARIVALGIDVRCGESLSTSEDFERLRAGFDAVYLAIGARCQKRLPRLDYTRPWVMDGADYLAQANAGNPPALGKRLVVIGGGSAALDVARSARRAGHAVTILALESAAQMPAQREEIAEALEEGIALVDGAMLSEAVDTGGAGISLRCVRVRFERGEPGSRPGQFTVTPLAGSEFSLEADAVVPSIGQDPELAPVQGALEIDGALLRTDPRQATSLERVYAGGDVASMARFVTEAIGMGKRAAREIDRLLTGSPQGVEGGAAGAGVEPAAEAVVGLAAVNTFYYPKQARAVERRLDAAQRLAGDDEVQIGLDLQQALAEAERCFSCGTCILCDNCVNYCPDLAVKRESGDGGGYVVLTDYCKGCGVCVKECPTGSMKMVEEAR